MALLERDLAGWDYDAERANVLAETTKAFVAVVAAQEQLALAEELLRLASRSVSAVDRQVKAGATSPVEATRAQVALGQAQVERTLRARELEAARFALAAGWGSTTPTFTRAVGELAPIPAPPPMEALVATVAGNPDLARWTTELAARRAAVQLEEAKRIPSVSVGAGPRYYSDTDDAALVFEFSVPLPLFDRNQGGIREAQERRAKSAMEQTAAEVSIRAALGGAYERLLGTFEQVRTLQETIIPAAEAAFKGSEDAYQKGVLRYLEVLDAQRTLFQLRTQYLQVLAAYHAAVTDVERLTGTALEHSNIETGRP